MSAEWIDALRVEVRRTSCKAAGQLIGMSATVVSQVLNGRYPGSLENVRQRVEGALLSRTVACPILGDLPRHECMDHQRRPFAATNAQRVKLYQACRNGCPHSRVGVTS